MPLLCNKQKLALGFGIILFLISCTYIPWERRIYKTTFAAVTGTGEVRVDYGLADPPETHYGWVFWRPVPKSALDIPGGGIEVSQELNAEFLLAEWLGICLLTGGLIWLLQGSATGPRRASTDLEN